VGVSDEVGFILRSAWDGKQQEQAARQPAGRVEMLEGVERVDENLRENRTKSVAFSI
jgi:hypothetical protein